MLTYTRYMFTVVNYLLLGVISTHVLFNDEILS